MFIKYNSNLLCTTAAWRIAYRSMTGAQFPPTEPLTEK